MSEQFIYSLIFSMVVILFGKYLHYHIRSYYHRRYLKLVKELQRAWQTFAASNDLTFAPLKLAFSTPADDTTYKKRAGARVKGYYRAHDFHLETLYNYSGIIRTKNTRISLVANHRSTEAKEMAEAALPAEDIMALLTQDEFKGELSGTFKVEPNGQKLSYDIPALITDVEQLQRIVDWLSDMADAYPKIIMALSEPVPALQAAFEQNKAVHPIALPLLRDMAVNSKRWVNRTAPYLLCPDCLTRGGQHKTPLGWRSITYHGCRVCGQSRRCFSVNSVVAVLDSRLTTEWSQEADTLYVNWLTWQAFFDFDTVMVAQATDEQVERFAVWVGNDTDPRRRPFYKTMPCRVSSACKLSANTLRILERTFGRVEMVGSQSVEQETTADERTVQALDWDRETREIGRKEETR